ncbi:hypothetical protein JCM21900_000214 [Sporobolomyces salmonicolor]
MDQHQDLGNHPASSASRAALTPRPSTDSLLAQVPFLTPNAGGEVDERELASDVPTSVHGDEGSLDSPTSDYGSIVFHGTPNTSGPVGSRSEFLLTSPSEDESSLEIVVDETSSSWAPVATAEGTASHVGLALSLVAPSPTGASHLVKGTAMLSGGGETQAAVARDDPSGGLLNPQAATFAFERTAVPHAASLDAYKLIIIAGKDNVGELTAAAKEALASLGLRPIPSLHGPLSLPYARCPSGIDAFSISAEQVTEPWANYSEDVDEALYRRQRTGPVPLPGNARYTQAGRLAQRLVSAPSTFGGGYSRKSSGVPPLKTGSYVPPLATRATRKTPPAFPPPRKPPLTSEPPSSLAQLQQQAVLDQVQAQAQAAYEVQQYYQHAQPHNARPFAGQHSAAYSYPSNIYAYGSVSAQAGPAAVLAAQYLHAPQQQSSLPQKQQPAATFPITTATYPIQPQHEVDSLALLQLARQLQHGLGGMGVQSELATMELSSYETPPDIESKLSEERDFCRSLGESLDPQNIRDLPLKEYEDGSEEAEPYGFPPRRSRSRAAQLERRRRLDILSVAQPSQEASAMTVPSSAYLENRRKSAAPAMPCPGGRRTSLTPAVAVGPSQPRRASLAPQVRLVRDPLPPPPATTFPTTSRRTSAAVSTGPSQSIASSSTSTRRRALSRQTYGNDGPASKSSLSQVKQRRLGEISNTLPHSSTSGPPVVPRKMVRHAADASSNWRSLDECPKSSSSAGRASQPRPSQVGDAPPAPEHVAKKAGGTRKKGAGKGRW